MGKTKRILSFLIAIIMVLALVPFNAIIYATDDKAGNEAQTQAPEKDSDLPSATVSMLDSQTISQYKIYDLVNEKYNGEGTTALNPQILMQFVAEDTAEEAASNKYAEYIADFYIKVSGIENAAKGTGCYLIGHYDPFGWVVVPLDEVDVENTTYPVITRVGHEFTYTDICTSVKDFKCGIYFAPEFLLANPNVEISLELGLSETFEKAQNAEYTKVGEAYTYDATDLGLPSATVGVLPSETVTEYEIFDLVNGKYLGEGTVALNPQVLMQFLANETLEEANKGGFADYIVDFYINIEGLAGETVGKDCYLIGHYGDFGWVAVPLDEVTVNNSKYPVVSAFHNITYRQVCESIKDFKCGIYFAPEFLEANPDMKVSLELGMSTTLEDAQNAIYTKLGETYTYTVESLTGKSVVIIPDTLTGEVVDEIKNNTALDDYKPENVPAGAELVIELVSVDDKIVYEVAPMANGAKVENLAEAIIFRLPIPASVKATQVKVYHDGALMGTYDINGEDNGKYVEISSDDFSEFAIEPVEKVVATVNGVGYKTLTEALKAVTDDSQTVTILSDITENLSGAYLRGNIVTANDAKVTITLTNADWVACPYTFVLGENITLNIPNGGIFYYAGGAVIKGTVVTAWYYQRYAGTKLTIEAPGSMTVTSETCIIRYMDNDANAGIYIVGDDNDETVELKLDVAYFYQGMINAKDATIVCGTYWQTNDTDGTGSANLVLDNSTLTVTVYDYPAKATGNSTVTLKNGSTMNCANGGFAYGDNAKLDIDATSVIIDKGNKPVVVPVASVNGVGYATLEEAIAAAQNGDEVVILVAGTYTVPSGKDITITGAVDGVVFDNIKKHAMGGASVTFNNVTFNYSMTEGHNGLQHSGDLVYNNCIFNGQVFLYGTSETFNDCTFNQTDVNNYNVWTYAADDVEFNGCTFYSAGRSLLIYSEGADLYANVVITDCDFISSNAVDGKAAIEMDSSLSAGIKVTIDAATTATGFGNGNVSGNSLWNNKKGNETAANNDITVVVNGVTVLAPVTYVAQIGDKKYTSLQDAINAAQIGETVVLLTDIELDAPITVTGTVTLDLAGYSIEYTSTVQGEAMITNKGNLTINDSAETGVINYNYVGAADNSYGKGNYTISNAGTLTVNGGEIRIANISGHAKYPIDNNSTTGDAILVINGGHLYNYNTSAIRMFCNSTTYKNSITINGGLIEGYCAIWVQNPGNKTVNANLTIAGGEIKTTAKAYVNGTAALDEVSSRIYFTIAGNGGAWSADSSVAITGGIINENVDLSVDAPEAYTVDKENATFNGRLVLPMIPVASVNGVGYATLEEAIAAAQNGETVVLLANIEDSATIKVAGKSITIDLAGYTISGTCNAGQASLIYIENNAALTVKDTVGEGKITYAQGTSNVGWTIDVKGEFVLESGTIELTGSWSIGYAVEVRPNSWGSEYTNPSVFVMNGGAIVSSDGAVRVASSSADTHKMVSASFVMNNGTIDAAWDGVFIQQSNTIYDVLSFTMNGGTINSALNPVRVYGPAPTGYVNGQNCMSITLAGGELNYTGTAVYEWVIDGILRVGGGSSVETIVENGTFVVSAAIAESATAPEGYVWSDNGDGTCTLAEKPALPEITVTFGNVTLSLNDYMQINYYVNLASLQGRTDVYAVVKVTHERCCGTDEVIYETVLDYEEWSWNADKTAVAICVKDIAAKNMGATVAVQIYTDDGNAVSFNAKYSIEQFAYAVLSQPENATYTKEFKATMYDMLAYGAQAQIRFGHATSNLVSKNLGSYAAYAGEDTTWSKGIAHVDGYQTNNIKHVSYGTLSLESSIEFNWYLKGFEAYYGSEAITAKVTYTSVVGEKETLVIDLNKGNGGIVYFTDDSGVKYAVLRIKGISAADMYSDLTIEVLVNGTSTCKFVDTIARQCTGSINAYPAEAELFQSILNYGQSAKEYIGK